MKTIACVKVGSLKDPDINKRGHVQVMDMPEQQMGDEDVKIKVAYCSICGSDPHLVEGIFGLEPPFGLGHEISGTIVEIGKKATKKGLKVGDKVAGNFLRFCGTCYYCRNGQEQFCEYADNKPGFSEYVVWHESQVFKIPDDVSLEEACLLEPVSIAVRIVDKTNMKIGQRVAISGGGPIGLLALQAMKMFGATSLTLIEPIKERQELAKEFGADYIIDPVEQDVCEESNKITDGLGFDLVIEASGSPKAAPAASEIAAKGGTVLYIAMFPKHYDMPLNLYDKLYSKELTISSINVAPYAFPRAAEIMPRMNLKPFIQKVFTIDQAEEAFAAQVSGKYTKILIKCNDF
ncbi:zinc-dependent alcohol dehydrogenase [Clostridium magnum]|uniref:D-arabitol-phosphate dehydrogenase n=1 Tax=Clostridium magnum DSM 2767 TaxID=1121326 RepID=A0A162R377_9CLOT|nr:alcohol dehydrogenase catalytic domain-containing protein [Clostridium magnum]KZL89361.1 D-arabitol-phosphate dehydrogenase [Clostridium magnum DSM 2767]SHI21028.1 (R,R)-butanediol dehydrogenase / meso-butanediol dehydrogenase / diacetyl reductase [Clostridium magnum DSM 2767]